MRSLMVRTPHHVLSAWWNQEELDRWGKWHAWGRTDRHTGFWWRNLRERDHLEDLGADGNII
jgi:hypothetical protein